MTKLTINGAEIEVPSDMTVLQACEAAGVEIPRFCYHEKLAIAGNCRMCLVEVEKSPKLVASCAQPIAEGMIVRTNSAVVKKAREGVLEFLLINHPLDCPICDQGGECDLQDQAMKYGKSYSRFDENKRSVVDKYMGPLISTNMNRCIHCTRCVRFLEEIAGTCELGAIGRGEDMEITTYIGNSITSELSGNIIDLCPVGALTAKPHAFQFRSWELKATDSIDVLDAVGSNILVNSRGSEVVRVLPRANDEINEEWISDKTRFACDGLKYQRLDVPMLRIGGALQKCDWDEAFEAVKKQINALNPNKISAIAGSMTDTETMYIVKELFHKIGSKNYECRYDGTFISNKVRSLYTFGTSIQCIEKSDLCLIVGSNPRLEAAMINARIRKAVVNNQMQVALLGEHVALNYPYEYLGNEAAILKQIIDKKHCFSQLLNQAKNPMIIVGAAVFARPDFETLIAHFQKLCSVFNITREDWNGFNVLQTAASRVGGLDIGFTAEQSCMSLKEMITQSELLFLFGADEVDIDQIPDSTFVVYQGHHGDRGASRADVVFPGAAYTEKDATYVNTEGRAQRTYMAVPPPYQAKADWLIVSELAHFLGFDLGFKTVASLRSEVMSVISGLENQSSLDSYKIAGGSAGVVPQGAFINAIQSFYRTDSISRSSKTMALCEREFLR